MELMLLIGGLVAGLVIGYFFAAARSGSQRAVLQEQLRQQDIVLQQQGKQLAVLTAEKEQLFARALRAETQSVQFQENLQNARKDSNQLGEQLKLEMEALAQKIAEKNTQILSVKNEEKIGQLLNPLHQELKAFKTKVEETYDKESKERFSLGKEIDRLVKMSEQVSLEANNLTTALKGNTKMQGNWGEMILESILEHSGLVKGREFLVQEFIRDNAGAVIKDEFGKGLQPDVTITYPDGRKLIVDSKVSLLAWDQFVQETDVAEQEKAMKNHIQSLRFHIDSLSKKNYPKYAQALDYVLLFVPIEPAFLEAVKQDAKLWKYAYDKKIMLVSPTNLLAVLKIVADLWKVEQQNKNAIEIAEKAGLLYDKFVGFIHNLELVGKKIVEVDTAYQDAYKQLAFGRGNLVGKVEELKKMGANASKQLPDRILYKIEEDK